MYELQQTRSSFYHIITYTNTSGAAIVGMSTAGNTPAMSGSAPEPLSIEGLNSDSVLPSSVITQENLRSVENIIRLPSFSAKKKHLTRESNISTGGCVQGRCHGKVHPTWCRKTARFANSTSYKEDNAQAVATILAQHIRV